MLNLSFLKILPLDEKPFNTYGLFLPLYEETKTTLRNDEVLPTKDEKSYVSLSRAILAGNLGLTDIFTGHDMAELQKRKTDFEWLPTTITERGAYSDLYAYLVNTLGVDVIRATELRIYFNSNVEFLEKKDNDWLVKLYKLYETIPSAFSFSGRSMLDAWIIRTDTERDRGDKPDARRLDVGRIGDAQRAVPAGERHLLHLAVQFSQYCLLKRLSFLYYIFLIPLDNRP